MVRTLAALTLAVVVASGIGCGTVATPVAGGLYTDVKWPAAVTSNDGGSKMGQSKATSYLGLIGIGDASIEAAAAAGGIKKIQQVNIHSRSILGLIGWYTVTVKGE